MNFFKNCCGCDGDSYHTEEQYAYERPRRAQQFSPELQRYQMREEDEEEEILHHEDAISVCPTSKALCDGQIHSLLEPNSFNPPLCSTKLVEEAKNPDQRNVKSTNDLSFHTGGTLSDSFWSDIHRWGKKSSTVQRRSTIHGISAETSSDFDSIVVPTRFKHYGKNPIQIEYFPDPEPKEPKKLEVVTESMLCKSVESNLYDVTDDDDDRDEIKSVSLVDEIKQINSSEVNSPEINSFEINSSEVNSSEIKSFETNSSEVNSPEIKSFEINSSEVISFGIHSPEAIGTSSAVNSPEVKSSAVNSSAVNSSEVSSTNVSACKSVRFTVEPVRSEFADISLDDDNEVREQCGLSFEADGRVSFKKM